MKTGPAIAEILKKEGVEFLFAYPVNHLIEACAAVDIRPIIVRQERTGLHMADAISRVTSGRKIGAFAMQHGPGTENAYGGIAQAWADHLVLRFSGQRITDAQLMEFSKRFGELDRVPRPLRASLDHREGFHPRRRARRRHGSQYEVRHRLRQPIPTRGRSHL